MNSTYTILVCGGRNYGAKPIEVLRLCAKLDALHSERPITRLVEGGAYGADRLAREWALRSDIPVTTYHADWKAHGRAAGPIRNRYMHDDSKPDLVVACPGGRGTADMVSYASSRGTPVSFVQEEETEKVGGSVK